MGDPAGADSERMLLAASPQSTATSPPRSDPMRTVPVALSAGWETGSLQVFAQAFEASFDGEQHRFTTAAHATDAYLRTLAYMVGGHLRDSANWLPNLDVTPPPTTAALDEFARAVESLLRAVPDRRIGHAYALGRDLCVLVLQRYGEPKVARRVIRDAASRLTTRLHALADALPAHSARAVVQSLDHWWSWLDQNSDLAAMTQLELLPRQGELFRALLTGERDAGGLLEVEDYLDAASGLAAALDAACEGAGTHRSTLVSFVATPLWSAFMTRAVAEAITLLPGHLGHSRGRLEMGQAPPG